MISISFAVFDNHDHVKPSILAISDAQLTIEIQEVNLKYCGILWPITTQARNLSTQKNPGLSMLLWPLFEFYAQRVSLIKLFGIWLSFSWKADEHGACAHQIPPTPHGSRIQWLSWAKETQDAMAIICGAMAALLEPLKAALVSKKDTCHAIKPLDSWSNVPPERSQKIHRIRIQSSSRHANNRIHKQ